MSLTDHQGHQSSERQSTVHATNSRYSWIPPYHQTNCCHPAPGWPKTFISALTDSTRHIQKKEKSRVESIS
ncbi:hypothetical protein LEMLEM_LOCUS6189, partial [Lemmus lemmus]